MEFNYQVIQLNRLNWRDFLNQNNPVASALMAKMKIDKLDRPKVKAECLRLLVTLKLDPARMQLISGFVDTYLTLNQAEELQFQSEIREFTQTEQEDVMQITTSWMRQGIERGIEQGIEQGIEGLVIRQLRRKFGVIDNRLENQIRALKVDKLEALGEALLEFMTVDDLEHWLGTNI